MVVIAHVSYTFEQNDEAEEEIHLVKFQLGNLSESRGTKIHHAAGELLCPFTRHNHVLKLA